MSRRIQDKASLWTGTLYYAQGLPFSIVRQMAVVFFKDQGASLRSLGFISLYGIPWTFKFLWSPLVDTVSTKRRWVVAMEFCLAMVIGTVACLLPMGANLQVVAAVLLVAAFVSATHDIATDGFYLEALNANDRAKYSGLSVAAYRLALLTGSGLLVGVSGKIGWTGTFSAAALILVSLAVWHQFMLPHPQKEVANEKIAQEVSLKKMAEGFRTFFLLPGVWLAVGFAIFFKLGDALMFGMSTPFLLDAGMTKVQLGLIQGVFGIASAIGASMLGGWYISKHGLRRGLWVFGLIQNLAIPVYALAAWLHNGSILILGVAVIIEQIAAALGTAAYSNFLMRQHNPNYKATHYAIVTGMMSLTTMMGGVLSGFGAEKWGFALFFTFSFLASLPGMFMIPFVARRPECQPFKKD